MIEIAKLIQHPCSSLLEIHFSDGFSTLVSFELLRVYSPNKIQMDSLIFNASLLTDKAFVRLVDIKHCATDISFHFSDGHRSELISARYLYQLCQDQDPLWLHYLQRTKLMREMKNNSIACQTLG